MNTDKKNPNGPKDLTVSAVDRQNILNNPFALSEIEKAAGIKGIPLFLFQKKKLSQPMFYLSEYLESNRDEYYQRLKNISEKQD